MIRSQVVKSDGSTGSFKHAPRPSGSAPFLYLNTDEFENRRRSRLGEIRVRNEQRLMQECTFHPDVHARQAQRHSIEMGELRRVARIREFLKERNKDLTHQPSLVTSPRPRTSLVPVYERLYALSKPTTPHSESVTPASSRSFSREPLSSRSVDRLYGDSIARKERQQARERAATEAQRACSLPKLRPQSERLLISSLEKQVRSFLKNQTVLLKSELRPLFRFLKFVSGPNEGIDAECHYLADAWNWLDTSNNEQVTIGRVVELLRCMYHVTTIKPRSQAPEFFSVFRDNRKAVLRSPTAPVRAPPPSIPTISQGSEKIVQKIKMNFGTWEGLQPSEMLRKLRESRSVGQRVQAPLAPRNTEKVNPRRHTWERLYSDAKEKLRSRAELQAQAEEKRLNMEIEGCSFRPQTNPNSSANGPPRAARVVRDFGRTTARLQNAWRKAKAELSVD